MKTKDLALATTLRVEGHEPDRMEVNDDREAVWVFPRDEAVDEIVADYHAEACEVEPRAYNVTLRKTRDELFNFLRANDITPKRARQN